MISVFLLLNFLNYCHIATSYVKLVQMHIGSSCTDTAIFSLKVVAKRLTPETLSGEKCQGKKKRFITTCKECIDLFITINPVPPFNDFLVFLTFFSFFELLGQSRVKPPHFTHALQVIVAAQAAPLPTLMTSQLKAP